MKGQPISGELVRSSAAVPPKTGMVIRLARNPRGEEVGSTPVEMIEDAAEFLLDRWAIWNVGLYDIIEMPSVAKPSADAALDVLGSYRADESEPSRYSIHHERIYPISADQILAAAAQLERVAESAPIRSSAANPPRVGMRVRRLLVSDAPVATVVFAGDDHHFSAKLEDDRTWIGLVATWNEGCYEILETPPEAAAPATELAPPWTCTNASAGCMSEWEPACSPERSPIDSRLCVQCEAHVGPPFKCESPDCKTPTAGQARTSHAAMVTCVACFDADVAAWTDEYHEAAKAGRPMSGTAYVAPRESVMGGARWIPNGRFGQWR